MKKLAFLAAILVLAAACELLAPERRDVIHLPDEIHQWAISATASSSFGGKGMNRDDQSPYSATGEPDVIECGDSLFAWSPNREKMGIQWLELAYDREVFVSGANIRQSFNPGAVIRVELADEEGRYHTLWEGKDPTRSCPGFLQVSYESIVNNITRRMTPFRSNRVRVTLDTDIGGWNQIDAVELVGYERRWTLFNETVVYE
jgi:hypothetical protein